MLVVVLGALLLIWPALWNQYPILFSDTGGLIEMSLEPTIGWDKPWIYGPFLHLFHWRQTLWPCVLAQGLIVSHLLWLVGRRFGPGRHVLLCTLLAVVSAAPWFVSLLMPDVFTAPVVLCLFLLAFGTLSRRETVWVGLIGTIGIASHLAHLILAAALIAVVVLCRLWPRWQARPLRTAVPLASALALLMLTNIVGLGRPAISPNGAVFALARLIGDGPGRDYIDRVCPAAGLKLCAWKGRLAQDSDEFLWDPWGPLWDRRLWGDAFGPVALAPEASRLVLAIVAAYPLETFEDALVNAGKQFILVRVGDTLGAKDLDVAVLPKMEHYFPPAEVARYHASRQDRGLLATDERPLTPVHLLFLLFGAAGTGLVLIRWRDPTQGLLALMILAGLAANAAATGALSAPHDRYQARLAWLLLIPPAYAAMAGRTGTIGGVSGARRATSTGDILTSAS